MLVKMAFLCKDRNEKGAHRKKKKIAAILKVIRRILLRSTSLLFFHSKEFARRYIEKSSRSELRKNGIITLNEVKRAIHLTRSFYSKSVQLSGMLFIGSFYEKFALKNFQRRKVCCFFSFF